MRKLFSKLDARVRFGVLAAILSVLVSYRGQPYLHQHPDALNTIVTVFSILAGFLVAIISIVGDSASLGRASWRRDQYLVEGVRRRLIRHKLLFQLYLVILGLVFLLQLIGLKDEVVIWYERAILFLASFAFLVSLALPEQLMSERLRKVERDAVSPPPNLSRQSEGLDDTDQDR
ncbi:MAG TPA: hypothetical protein VM576_00055 [Xanthomonadaceae bacterium]|nr:hypothetical protein [Xanthomonadaceae bacterium]